MKRVQTIAILVLFWICAILVVAPALANTEYAVPNSTITIGVSSNVDINISYSAINPTAGIRIYSDSVNETWCIPPDKSPDGKLNIIIIPIEQEGDLWSWFTSWM